VERFAAARHGFRSQQVECLSTTLEAAHSQPPGAACPGPHRASPGGRPRAGGTAAPLLSSARALPELWVRTGPACPGSAVLDGLQVRWLRPPWWLASGGAPTCSRKPPTGPGHRRRVAMPGKPAHQCAISIRHSTRPLDAGGRSHFLTLKRVRARAPAGGPQPKPRAPAWRGGIWPPRSGQPRPCATMQEAKGGPALWLDLRNDSRRATERSSHHPGALPGALAWMPTTPLRPDCTGRAITGWAAQHRSAAATQPPRGSSVGEWPAPSACVPIAWPAFADECLVFARRSPGAGDPGNPDGPTTARVHRGRAHLKTPAPRPRPNAPWTGQRRHRARSRRAAPLLRVPGSNVGQRAAPPSRTLRPKKLELEAMSALCGAS